MIDGVQAAPHHLDMLTLFVLVFVHLPTGTVQNVPVSDTVSMVQFTSPWQCARARAELTHYIRATELGTGDTSMADVMVGCEEVTVKLKDSKAVVW